MKKNAFDPVRVRIWALTGLMGLCLVAFAGVMYYTQILHGEENRAKSLAECQQQRVQEIGHQQGQTCAQNGAQKALAQKPLGDHSRQQRRCQKGQCIKAGDDPRHGQIAQQAEYSGKGGPLAGALQHGGDGSDQRRQKGMHAPHADAVEHQGLHQNQQQGGPGIVQPLEKHIPLVQGLVHGVTPQSTMVKSVMTKTSTSWVMSVLGRMVA